MIVKDFGAVTLGIYDLEGGHNWPTESYGGACNESVSPYLGNCSYNVAHNFMEFLLGEKYIGKENYNLFLFHYKKPMK